MSGQKYVPELNCFLRRWRALDGPPKIKALFHRQANVSVNGPGSIYFSEDPERVRMVVLGERWGWNISPGSRSARLKIRFTIKGICLEVYDYLMPREIQDYW